MLVADKKAMAVKRLRWSLVAGMERWVYWSSIAGSWVEPRGCL